MEDETGELVDSLQSLQNDYENLGVGMERLEAEIYDDNPSNEGIKKRIEEVESWVTEISSLIDNLDDARMMFHKRQILNKLEDEDGE